MGLLDDAIREHLELKRRHGGDPSEIARQEHEALGPVRRTSGPDAMPPESEAPAAGSESSWPGDAPLAAEPAAEPAMPAPVSGVEPAPVDRLPPAPGPAAGEAPSDALGPDGPEPLPDHLSQPTVEFSVEEHFPSAPSPAPSDADIVAADEDDDVLEETPDFLQETPEHDRLWFEQKPPRDFDFDG